MNASANTQPTLLFIPDISGFTAFVNSTEITHSQHIIEELLEVLIDANEIGLEVSEIEGDAILFYRTGTVPTAAELLAQVQRMYVQFHAHLKWYESHRICQCGACSTANNLTLKFILHHGDIGMNQVREFTKLFGKDVIIAHRLMKNDVPHEDYVLITHQLINACTSWVQIEQVAWSMPQNGQGQYDFGAIDYCYLSLTPLESHVPEPTVEDYTLSGKLTKIGECDIVVEAPIDLVFSVISDLSIRHDWTVGLNGTDQLNSKITRHGSTHRCVIKGDESDPFLVSHGFQVQKDFITFTDTNHRDGQNTVSTLRRIGNQVTRVRVHFFMKRHLLKELVFNLFMKKKMAKVFDMCAENLKAYCETLLREGREPVSRILLEPADGASVAAG